jgi:hypothetical protein
LWDVECIRGVKGGASRKKQRTAAWYCDPLKATAAGDIVRPQKYITTRMYVIVK